MTIEPCCQMLYTQKTSQRALFLFLRQNVKYRPFWLSIEASRAMHVVLQERISHQIWYLIWDGRGPKKVLLLSWQLSPFGIPSRELTSKRKSLLFNLLSLKKVILNISQTEIKALLWPLTPLTTLLTWNVSFDVLGFPLEKLDKKQGFFAFFYSGPSWKLGTLLALLLLVFSWPFHQSFWPSLVMKKLEKSRLFNFLAKRFLFLFLNDLWHLEQKVLLLFWDQIVECENKWWWWGLLLLGHFLVHN